MDLLAADLNILSFECGLTENEKELRARSAGLTICGCAHAVFLCKLAHTLREAIARKMASRDSLASEQESSLCVGIMGMGHIGKHVALSLLEMTAVKPSHIKISTRRPEASAEFVQKGIECYFDNRRLAAWADVIFLCCLPTHLPKVCAELHSHLPKHCLVYSFISAVSAKRLAQLLGHNFILKPQYDFVACDTGDMWLSQCHLTLALKDPTLIKASSPLAMSGGISLDLKWVYAVLYSLLNMCTSASLGTSETLALINDLFQRQRQHTLEFTAQSYVSSSYASALTPEEPFPWINLIDAQTKETPLSCFVSRSKFMQDSVSAAYKSLLEDPVKRGD